MFERESDPDSCPTPPSGWPDMGNNATENTYNVTCFGFSTNHNSFKLD